MALMQELKRRRVFRVAGLYLLVSWVMAEVADVVFPALMLPDWTITFVILLLMKQYWLHCTIQLMEQGGQISGI